MTLLTRLTPLAPFGLYREQKLVLYYLGQPVEPVGYGDGYVPCRGADGRVFRYWRTQLRSKPWGEAE